jgi:hypothetical protein
MKILQTLFVGIVVLVVSWSIGLSDQESGFVPLFDGKTLK